MSENAAPAPFPEEIDAREFLYRLKIEQEKQNEYIDGLTQNFCDLYALATSLEHENSRLRAENARLQDTRDHAALLADIEKRLHNLETKA